MHRIKPYNNNGRCCLRFSYVGEKYFLTVGSWTNPSDVKFAELLAERIYLDCRGGTFDKTLQSYSPQKKLSAEKAALKQKAILLTEKLRDRISANFNEADKALYNLLIQFEQPITDEKVAQKFIDWLIKERKLKNSSVNRYLGTLKKIAPETFADIKQLPEIKHESEPFTEEEVTKILEGFKEHPSWNHYYPFIFFLLNTGCRISEAIGLRWEDVKFTKDEIYIGSSLKRNKGSTSKRVRSTTKTGNSRVIPMNPGLRKFLKNYQSELPNEQELVFVAPKGGSIDDHSFSQKIWKTMLFSLEIEYRSPYNCRHTFISHCLSKGMEPLEVAKIAGHDPKVLFDHYAGVIKKPVVPDLYQ